MFLFIMYLISKLKYANNELQCYKSSNCTYIQDITLFIVVCAVRDWDENLALSNREVTSWCE